MEYVDLAFTPDGDLILGEQAHDSNDNPLSTDDGRPIRDLTYVTGEEAIKQLVTNRIKTQAPDWFLHPQMGGNLEDLIGEPNTRETGEVGVQKLYDVLTYDGFLHRNQLEIRAVPVSLKEVIFFITVTFDSEDYEVVVPVPFSYTEGLKGDIE